MYRKKIPIRRDSSVVLFFLIPAAILFYFLFVMLSLKMVFIAMNWHSFRAAGFHLVGEALLKGLRFDMAALAYVMIPVLVLYFIFVSLISRRLNRALLYYLTIFGCILSFLFLADIQYFEEAGKHFTYEALSYLDSATPMISGAFRLHPLLSTMSLIACIATAALTWFLSKSLFTICLYSRPSKVYLILFIPIWVGALVIGIRGGVQRLPLSVGDALISTNPYINALCLNPVYSTLRTLSVSSMKTYNPLQEAQYVSMVKLLLDVPNPPISPDYPVLRLSDGNPGGIRKNVVLFILESWAGKDIGILGGNPEVTPFFDHLSQQGMFFTNFFANGLRTPEGILSTLCSFPNQPIQPIMNRPEVFLTQWRALSQILAEEGYYNIFIHGRDLNFDRMRKFLESISFHKIIDRRDFPPSSRPMLDSWPGYNDEEVMQRANEEFSHMGDRPFLGVIYTMNTHIPFPVPPDFPLLYPPTNPRQKFLNALHYSDYTLKVFFDLAKKQAYFNNTIFVLTADHAVVLADQPRATAFFNFNYGNQHHIPLLIYSPHDILPSCRRVVGGQTDILPTILGLLKLKVLHAAWGRDLCQVAEDRGFDVSISGNEAFFRQRRFLLVDCLTGSKPLFFDLGADPGCTRDVWGEAQPTALRMQDQLKAYVALSQKLLYENRIYPHL